MNEEQFETWKAKHEAEIAKWFDNLDGREQVQAVFAANEDIDSDVRYMVEKPWKWAAEAYYYHLYEEVPV